MLKTSLLFTMFFLFLYSTLFVSSAEANSEKASVTVESLNVRSGPSVQTDVLASLNKDATISILGKTGEWSEFFYEGKKAYVHSNYIKIHEEVKFSSQKMESTVSNLNIRDYSSLNSSVIGSLQKGEKVEILKKSGDWGLFIFNGKNAYVHLSYMKDAEVSLPTYNAGVVTASKLNVRKGPSTTEAIVSSLNENEKVSYINSAGEWLKVFFEDSLEGYVHSAYIQQVKPAEHVTPPANGDILNEMATVTAAVLNARQGPGINFEITHRLNKGEVFKAVAEKDGWVKININNTTAYVSKTYITLEDAQKKTDLYYVTASNLNVRNKASLASSVVGSLKMGERVEVLDTIGDWSTIYYEDKTAYISKSYITATEVTANNPEPNKTSAYTVDASALNVRDKPSTTSDIVGKLHERTVVEVIKIESGWATILFNENIAYVSAEYLTSSITKHFYYVTASTLNVRVDKDTSSTILGKVTKGEELRVVGEENGWYQIDFNGEKAYVSSSFVKQTEIQEVSSTNLTGKTIVLDAGHGGNDPGGISNGLYEKNIALDISNALKRKFSAAGAEVIMTRNSDSYLTLGQRTAISNNSNGDIFISVHGNASGFNSVHGIETFYYDGSYDSRQTQSRQLAMKVQAGMVNATNARDRGVKAANFQVIAYNRLPSVLVEVGFLSNSSEALLLASRSYQEKIVSGIYRGVVEHLED